MFECLILLKQLDYSLKENLNLVRNLIAKYSTYNFYIMKEENNWKTPFSVFVVF